MSGAVIAWQMDMLSELLNPCLWLTLQRFSKACPARLTSNRRHGFDQHAIAVCVCANLVLHDTRLDSSASCNDRSGINIFALDAIFSSV